MRPSTVKRPRPERLEVLPNNGREWPVVGVSVARRTALVVALLAIHAASGSPLLLTLQAEEGQPEAAGVLRPMAPPSAPPTRVDAGGSCIVDLVQGYELSGTLSGSASIDYRILVRGPCGSPPATFSEEWIAYGNLQGRLNDTDVTATFTYLAAVAGGEEVAGTIVLNDGLQGVLRISGQFADRKLSYTGWAR